MGRCPACAADLTVTEPVDNSRLRRLRRKHLGARHRPAAVIVVAVFVVASGIVGIKLVLGHGTRDASPSSGPPWLHARTRATLVYTLNDIEIIDADTGRVRQLPMPTSKGGASDATVVRVGAFVLLNRGNHAWLYGRGLAPPPVDLGPSLRIIPGPTTSTVWLWTADTGHLRLVDLTTRQTVLVRTLPDGWFPDNDATASGVVLFHRFGLMTEVWNPNTNQVAKTFDGLVLAATANIVIWDGPSCAPGQPGCVLHLTDMRSGSDTPIPIPNAGAPDGSGAVSPDGTEIAIPVRFGATAEAGEGTAALAVIDMATRALTVVPDSQWQADPLGMYPPTWSPTGWVFFAGYDSQHILAWRPHQRTASVLTHATLPPPEAPQGNTASLTAIAAP